MGTGGEVPGERFGKAHGAPHHDAVRGDVELHVKVVVCCTVNFIAILIHLIPGQVPYTRTDSQHILAGRFVRGQQPGARYLNRTRRSLDRHVRSTETAAYHPFIERNGDLRDGTGDVAGRHVLDAKRAGTDIHVAA